MVNIFALTKEEKNDIKIIEHNISSSTDNTKLYNDLRSQYSFFILSKFSLNSQIIADFFTVNFDDIDMLHNNFSNAIHSCGNMFDNLWKEVLLDNISFTNWLMVFDYFMRVEFDLRVEKFSLFVANKYNVDLAKFCYNGTHQNIDADEVVDTNTYAKDRACISSNFSR